jgi:hypothetical protein
MLLVETTAVTLSGMVRYLRELWGHLYPASPPPKYQVYREHHGNGPSEFTTTVHLRVGPCSDSTQYTFQSGVTSQVTRAIQEAVMDALLLLRTFDHNMASHPRYTYFPRMDTANGDTIFTSPPDVGSPITQLLRLTSLLLEYLQDTLTVLDIFRMDLATAEMSRVLERDIISGIPLPRPAPAPVPAPPTIPRLSSWTTVRNSFPSAPATQSPFAPTRHSAAPAHRVVRFQHSSLSPFALPFRASPNFLSLSTDTETPSTPLAPDSPLSYEPASEDRVASTKEDF